MNMSKLKIDVPPPPFTFGDRIKAVRRSWGWSQEKLAKAVMVDQASISFWERDKIKPSGTGLVALASLFRTSVQALEEGTGFHPPDPPTKQESTLASFKLPKCVSLPVGEKDKIIVVDLVNGSFRDYSLSETMMGLVEGMNAHRSTWIVLE